ncbi:MAG TPA: nucleotidyltransferase family protein [Myxococcales bacterium]|nr:nucleotidyltransferase family protein [Myxococcales bacterium]
MSGERTGPVAGVILAAGRSTRMGRNKLLLELGGESVLHRTVGVAAAAGLDPLVVVLGHEAERVREELRGLRCAAVFNAAYSEGMSTSLREGFRAVPDEAACGVALLGDMPLVSAAMIAALVDRFRAGRATLVSSTYGGVVAPPVLYGRALFAELRALQAGDAGRQVVQRHRREAEEIAWPASALADLDVPADLERARAALAAREATAAAASKKGNAR